MPWVTERRKQFHECKLPEEGRNDRPPLSREDTGRIWKCNKCDAHYELTTVHKTVNSGVVNLEGVWVKLTEEEKVTALETAQYLLTRTDRKLS